MRIKTLTRVFPAFKKYRWHVTVLVGLGFLSAIIEGIGINAVVPLVTFFTGGTGTPADPISQAIHGFFTFLGIPFLFRYLLFFIVVLFFFRAVFMIVFGYIRGWVTADFLSSESADILRRTLGAQWPYLLKQKIGTLQSTAIRDVQQTTTLLMMLVQLIQSSTGFLMYLLVAFNISPLTTFLTLGGGGVLVLIVRPLLVRTNRMGEEMAATEKDVAQFVSEHLIGMKTLKASGSEEQALAHGVSYIKRLRGLTIRLMGIRSFSGGLFQPFSIIFIVIVFALTYKSPSFSIVSFAATLYLIQKIFTYLDSGQTAMHGVFEYVPYARNLLAFKQTLSAHAEVSQKGAEPMRFERAIRFEGVSFSYDTKTVLSDVSFEIQKGMAVGFVGTSGAGKTTIADLFLRLFTPTGGMVTVDGRDISTVSLNEWRGAIGYVAQEAFLLNASIGDNIRFYRQLSDVEVEEAARQANILEYIQSLPEGFGTLVGDRGVMLSGGQRQRVALARALAGKPQILVLDEATSALDSESERLIQEAIYSLHGAVTVIMIAHRLSTLNAADRIFVLEQGAIAEEGTPEELRADPASYLSRMQES